MGHYIYGSRHRAGGHLRCWRRGQRHPARDRAILISNAKGVERGGVRAQALRDPAGGSRRPARRSATSTSARLVCRSIIYKGMMLASRWRSSIPDLMDTTLREHLRDLPPRCSTNTFPRWWLAQPFHMLAHDGEINTLKGNLNWLQEPRDPHALGLLRRARRGHQADRAAGVVGSAALDNVFEVLVRAGASRRWPRPCWCPRPGRSSRPRCRRLARHVRLFQRGDGALGRAGGAGDDRRALGLRRARPQRAQADALRRHRRRAGDRRLGGRHGADRRDERGREGRARAGAAARGRHGRGPALPRRRDQGPLGGEPAVRRVGRLDHRSRGADPRHRRAAAVRGRRAAAAAGRGRLLARGAGDHPASDGRRRQGSDRLDGRRHPARGALRPLPAAQPLFPARLQPGDEPADRLACASIG